MDIRVLRYVEAIARLGSFTKASVELHVAQPALSIAIKKLEEELRVTLFVRQARQVTATPEGLLLLKRAHRIFQEFEATRRDLEAAADLSRGEIKVGLPPMYGLAYFPSLIASFRKQYPGIVVAATVGSASDVRRQVDDGSIDLGLIEERRVPQTWKRVKVGKDETVLAVRADHALARKRRVSGRDLDGLDMVVFDHSFFQRQLLDRRCHDAGSAPRYVLQSNSVPIIVQAIRDGLGSSTLLRSLVEADSSLSAVSFDPIEVFNFCLCWQGEHLLSRASRAFVQHAQEKYDDKPRAKR